MFKVNCVLSTILVNHFYCPNMQWWTPKTFSLRSASSGVQSSFHLETGFEWSSSKLLLLSSDWHFHVITDSKCLPDQFRFFIWKINTQWDFAFTFNRGFSGKICRSNFVGYSLTLCTVSSTKIVEKKRLKCCRRVGVLLHYCRTLTMCATLRD